ncbi:GPI inositol-deacylase PGAP1-like protein [Heracleum sosnowskyi]|uniref:GPI inositol-deacylase PGAP1-like protein n=1 Tax=Heracleum sosnowskyi TaxID=360622 RepID=A0AAD8JC35_9APIA|nr:GPI inositol-deacylase PGAP1-like protein [Heracleum sosnowskyi]
MAYGYFSPLIELTEDFPSMGLTESTPSMRVTKKSRSMGLTENSSATYLSSGNACLDFFFHVVPDTPPSQLVERLKAAWDHNPLTTLKLICNLRGVRGTGKTDKEGFYTAALWLFKNHPKTLACNVLVYALFGYFKDLLEIMFRILEGSEVRTVMKKEWESVKSASKLRGLKRKFHVTKTGKKRTDTRTQAKKKRELRAEVPKEERIEANKAKVLEEKQRARDLKKEKALERSKKAMDMYNTDMDYQLLFENVSTLFADLLKADIQFVNSGEAKKISLAGKWCPTIDSSYDKYTLIYSSIAKKVFPRESYPEYEGIPEDQYVYKVRTRLRKEVLVPLHEVLKLPEVYMSAKEWNLIAYSRVASVAMKNYTKIFMDHDKERFSEYLMNVKQGKSKIAAGALLPHEIVRSCMESYSDSDSDSDSEGEKTVAELQWKRMVEDMKKKGKLTNCIAVCDVSGSMSGTPMEVSVALGLLVSELSEEPWKGQVITFSKEPQLHIIKGDTLQEKYNFVRFMKWGMNTNFQKVFDRILEVAVTSQLSQQQMVKTVFVFSDMEFDQASLNPWETDYQVLQKKFRKSGYRVPEIVFWNLRSSSATPVKATQNGVALLSGFSKNLLTMFLDGGGEISPQVVMEAAISGDDYQKLVLYD